MDVKHFILIEISLKDVPRLLIDNNPTFIYTMAWHCVGDKPLAEPMLTQFTNTYLAPSHFLNQCWVNVNWTLRNFGEILIKIQNFSFTKWKYCLQNGSHFVQGGMLMWTLVTEGVHITTRLVSDTSWMQYVLSQHCGCWLASRNHFVNVPCQWEWWYIVIFSHWLGACTKWSLG